MFINNLELFLITYNRCDQLENTLDQLSRSPFRDVKLTIFDNHSSDRTPEICRRYEGKFSDLNIVRRDKNIGGGPNFLRAIEASRSVYTWILCDDDNYDFSDCADVIEAINNASCDLIWVSNEHLESWEKGILTTADRLMSKGARYYPALSFVPSIIFRTDLFDSECLQQGYCYYEYLYPQFPFIHKSYCDGFSIYVGQNPIITRGWGATGSSPFTQYAAWVKCCLLIPENKLRIRAIEDLTVAGGGLLKELFSVIACERMDFSINTMFWKNAVLIYLAYSFRQRLVFVMAFSAAMLLPRRFLQLVRRIRYKLRGDTFITPEDFDKRDVYDD